MHRGGRRPITDLSGISQGAALGRGLLELARAPPRRHRVLLYVARVQSRWPPRPPHAPASTHTHAQAHRLPDAPPRCRPKPYGFAHARAVAGRWAPGLQCAAAPVAAAVRRPRRRWRNRRPPALGGLGTRAAPGATRARRPAKGRRPACHGDAAAAARLPGPVSETLGDPRPCAGAHGQTPVSPPWLRFGCEGAGGPRAPRSAALHGPRPGWQRQRSGADSFNEARRFSVSTTLFLCFQFSLLACLIDVIRCGLITQRASVRLCD